MLRTDLLLYEMHCHLIMLQCFNGKISLILSISSNHIKSSYNKSPNYMKLHQSNLTYQVRLCSVFHIVVYTCLSEARFIHSPSERNLRDSPRGRKEEPLRGTFERFLSADLTWSKQQIQSVSTFQHCIFHNFRKKKANSWKFTFDITFHRRYSRKQQTNLTTNFTSMLFCVCLCVSFSVQFPHLQLKN